jgi:hypothetical protein
VRRGSFLDVIEANVLNIQRIMLQEKKLPRAYPEEI